MTCPNCRTPRAVTGARYCYVCGGCLCSTEPTFTLRASDPVAPAAIRLWAAQSWQQGADPEAVAQARATAEAMEKWRCERIVQRAHPEDGHQPDECPTGDCRR